MSFLKELFSIFKKNDVALIKKYKESEDVYSFLFQKPKDLSWHAGQHGLFAITHKKIKNGIRPFTVASSPTEDVVKITTKIGGNPSEFKKALLELEEGMTIKLSGPVGGFYLKDNSHSLFIAGGIGITPFRSIIKQLEADGVGNERKVKLLYLDSDNSHIFKDELDEIVNNTSIEIVYLHLKDDLFQEIEKFIATYQNDATYFVAGPKFMVESITKHLQTNQIQKRNIKKDSFFGY